MTPGHRWASLPQPVRLIATFVAYYASARLGLRLALVGHIVTPLWPPTGVAIVVLTAPGRSVLPAIAAAAFAVNVSLADSWLVAAGIALGNTVAPWAGAMLLRRVQFSWSLARQRDAIFLVVAALASMTISATIGTASIALGGASIRIFDTWWVWWAGDTMGVLIVAPFLWSLARLSWRHANRQRTAEAIALFALLAVSSFYVTRTEFLFVVLPLLAWIAWRFQLRGAAPGALVTSVLVVIAAAHHQGLFADLTLMRRMVLVQAFNASVALTSLLFAAAITERRAMLQQLYQREHRIAETLQRSLMPELPNVPGVAVAARYLPATDEVAIGGDWYDVIPLDGDRLGLVVGDVAGHGLSAAAAMAQLRMGLRSYALSNDGPAAVVGQLNRLAVDLLPGTMATLLYAEYDANTEELRVANAGHPPPLLVSAEHQAEYLGTTNAVPIGVTTDFSCVETTHSLGVGATLLLYTDGLIERRGTALDDRFAALQRLSTVGARDLDTMCDRITTGLGVASTDDDVAILALRPTSLAGERLRLHRPATPDGVGAVRRILRRWLHANGASEDETYDLLLACTEAQTNAVRHAYRRPEGIVDVEAAIDHGVVTITVRDQGTWRAHEGETEGDGGWGLPVIESLMDVDVEIDHDAGGTAVRMRRRLAGASRRH